MLISNLSELVQNICRIKWKFIREILAVETLRINSYHGRSYSNNYFLRWLMLVAMVALIVSQNWMFLFYTLCWVKIQSSELWRFIIFYFFILTEFRRGFNAEMPSPSVSNAFTNFNGKLCPQSIVADRDWYSRCEIILLFFRPRIERENMKLPFVKTSER